MSSFTSDYDGAETAQLAVSYRSSPELVATLNGIAEAMAASEGMLPLALGAEGGRTGVEPEVRSFETPDDELGGIAASIRELERSGVPLQNQAVLCRTNARLNDVAEALESRGIPVLHLGSFFERSEIRDLLAMMTLAVDEFGDGLARVGAMARYDLSLQDVYVGMRHLRAAAGGPALKKLGSLAADPSLSPEGRTIIERLANDVAALSQRASPWEFLTSYLLDRTDHVAQLARDTSVQGRMKALAVWQLLNLVRERSPAASGIPIRRTLDQIRQLVLLAEERDLRQIPEPAQHLEAVRLMTVHGSKGLEFDAVHVPGLTATGFPSQGRPPRCPLPDGLIEGNTNGEEQAKRAHAEEEECLFFVAASRARTHLRLYRARKQENGSKRQASRFLTLIPIREIADGPVISLPAGHVESRPVTVHWPDGAHHTGKTLELFEKCPRRFFFTHVLGLGGGRAPTAFTRTHDCLYALFAWLADARSLGAPELAAVEASFERIWLERGPTDHAFAAEYHDLGLRLVRALVEFGNGLTFQKNTPLEVALAGKRVLVEPDELAADANGTVVIRRVRTGRKRASEYDGLLYSLYILAAREMFGTAHRFEAIHLTDETHEVVSVTEKKVEGRQAKTEEFLRMVETGRFPPLVSAVTCPRCPHFFVCGATPRGALKLS